MSDDNESRLEREIADREAELNELRAQPYESIEAAAEAARSDPEAFNTRFDALTALDRPLYEKGT